MLLKVFAERIDYMDIELLKRLSQANKETRELAYVVLELAGEKDDIIRIANKIKTENINLLDEVADLRMDKTALIAFIDNNVTDEKLKSEIFKGDK